MTRAHIVAILLALAAPGGALGQEPPAPVRVTERGVVLDFQDADLRLVLSALAEAGGINVIYSDLPARRVTLRTNQPVARENVRALLRSLAASNGLVVEEDDDFVRIRPAAGAEARAAGGQTAAEADSARGELRLFVYRLRHARAPRLAATLQALFGGVRTPNPSGGLSRPPLSERLRQQQMPAVTGGEGEGPPRVDVELSPAGPSLPAQLRGELQIVPDEATNALLVRAQEADWAIVRQAIEALDLRPLQVLIEVTIAEVRRTRDLDVGLSARASRGDSATGPFASGTLKGAGAGDFALRLMRVGSVEVDVALSALSATGQVRILSRPVVLAQNNQEARILIGAERPFIQVFRSLPTDAAIRDQIVQYRDVGTSLSILPTINPDGYVNLQIVQEVSTATSETQFGAPVISTREAATHLFVKDGQTVVIGGLIDQQRDRTESGIPVLKEIPLLGGLFRSTRDFQSESELFLFLTPHIVETDEDAERFRDELEQQTPLLRKHLPELGPGRIKGSGTPPDTTGGRG